MMCSSWKISVFGIVALMLAFGLATSDAGAADPSEVEVEVSADGNTALRAAQEGRIITFELDLSGTDAAATKDGTIEIIPTGRGWSSPRLFSNLAALPTDPAPAAGSVSFQRGADGPTANVTGGRLIATVASGYDSTITWQYKTNIPVTATIYKFRIKSTVHDKKGPQLMVDRDLSDPDNPDYSDGNIQDTAGAVLVDDAATFADSGNNIVIIVGPVASGSGTFVLTTTGIPKGADGYKNDVADDDIVNYNRAGQYFVTAEKEYNLVFTYTAAGTMHKGSVIRFTIPQDDTIAAAGEDWPLLTEGAGAGRLVVSGATLYSFDTETGSERQTAAAFLSSPLKKGDRVKFTYTTKTPKVAAGSNPATCLVPTQSLWTVRMPTYHLISSISPMLPSQMLLPG